MTAPTSTWTLDRTGPVASLTLHRPPHNFIDFASVITLGDLLDELAAHADQVTVVLLASGVDDVFINHAELSDLARAGSGQATGDELGSWARALRLLEEIPQPTIAAIDGLAAGGGNEIALACTLRVGSSRARMQQPEVRVGIIPGGGGSVRLPRLIGPGLTADAILSGREVQAPEAVAAGWINAVLPTVDFHAHAVRWAAGIAQNPGPALYAAKKSIVLGTRLPFPDALALEQQLFNDLSANSPTFHATADNPPELM